MRRPLIPYKVKKAPFAYSGAFFEEKVLKYKFRVKLTQEEVDESESIQEMAKLFFMKCDKVECKALSIIDASKLEINKGKGWFIGAPIMDMPEGMSRKRYNIEVRELLESSGIIKLDDDPEIIDFIIDIIESSEE